MIPAQGSYSGAVRTQPAACGELAGDTLSPALPADHEDGGSRILQFMNQGHRAILPPSHGGLVSHSQPDVQENETGDRR